MATVAVVIPVYATPENHRLDFLGQTLRSVQLQTHKNSVYLIVDDGSSADVEGFFREHGDNRGRYVRRERSPTDMRTSSNALNFGINLCLKRSPDVFTQAEAADLVALAYLHSDDVLTSQSLQRRLEALSAATAFVYTDIALLNVQSGVVTARKVRRINTMSISQAFNFPHHTTMWTFKFAEMLAGYAADVYGQGGIFDSRLLHGEDLDATLSGVEVARIEKMPLIYVPFTSYLYFDHQQSISGELSQQNLLGVHSDLICSKHFQSKELTRVKLEVLLTNLTADLPWSLGSPLPRRVKRQLRPVRDGLKRLLRLPATGGRGDYVRFASVNDSANLERLLAQLQKA